MSIKIAIIGGSIAGCTLANALLQHSHISFDIFDGKATFSERGAGVSLGPNAQKALRAMSIDPDELLKGAGAVTMQSTYCLVGHGEHKGKRLLELPGGACIVDRKQWLDVLLDRLPKNCLHSKKKLASIAPVSGGGSYRLQFEDGTVHHADTVIGCDGIRSLVRQQVLGEQLRERWGPRFGGYWDARGRTTPQKAAEQFGTELFDPTEPSEVALVGQGAFLLFAPTDEGRVYHVVVSSIAGAEYDKTAWRTEMSKEVLERLYKDWSEPFRDGVINSLITEESGPGVVFSQWESPETPFYNRHALCVMGDAAHATLPWMGQGACLSTEDAAVMGALIGSVKHEEELPAAFEAFSHVRRDRAEHVVRQSQEAAKLLTGQFSLDPAEVAHLEAPKWWTAVWDIDMEKHVQEAIRYHRRVSGRSDF